jgi:hypothetical protein
MLLFVLLTLIGQTQQSVPSTSQEVDDRPILKTALADPSLIAKTECGRFDLFQRTHLAALSYVTAPVDEIQLDVDHTVFTLPTELIESVRLRNQRSVPLKGVAKPFSKNVFRIRDPFW